MSNPTHDANDAGGGPLDVTIGTTVYVGETMDSLVAERDRLRAFIASLKAKAQQSIIILPRHFEAFERGETGA
jgi:hypothetical protein